MSTLLVTVIFLLADGRPAKQAWVYCSGLVIALVGSDRGETIENAPLMIDSRGALLINSEPKTITCSARQDGQVWRGPIVLSKAEKIQRIYLKEAN